MSKTIDLQLEKSRSLAVGLRKHVANGKDTSITNASIDQMEERIAQLAQANEECDRLRAELSVKVKAMNATLAEVKETYHNYKQNIKGYYPQEQWIDYGVADKR